MTAVSVGDCDRRSCMKAISTGAATGRGGGADVDRVRLAPAIDAEFEFDERCGTSFTV